MKLLEVNGYLKDYDGVVVFFIEEDVYKYNVYYLLLGYIY